MLGYDLLHPTYVTLFLALTKPQMQLKNKPAEARYLFNFIGAGLLLVLG
jgi:hypothetical protein